MGLVINTAKSVVIFLFISTVACGSSGIIYQKPHMSIIDGQESRYCSSWSLTVEQVEEYFKKAKRISSVEVKDYYYGACDLVGAGEINGRVFRYHINAGGIGQIATSEGEEIFGCKLECKQFMDFGFYEYGDERDFD